MNIFITTVVLLIIIVTMCNFLIILYSMYVDFRMKSSKIADIQLKDAKEYIKELERELFKALNNHEEYKRSTIAQLLEYESLAIKLKRKTSQDTIH